MDQENQASSSSTAIPTPIGGQNVNPSLASQNPTIGGQIAPLLDVSAPIPTQNDGVSSQNIGYAMVPAGLAHSRQLSPPPAGPDPALAQNIEPSALWTGQKGGNFLPSGHVCLQPSGGPTPAASWSYAAEIMPLAGSILGGSLSPLPAMPDFGRLASFSAPRIGPGDGGPTSDSTRHGTGASLGSRGSLPATDHPQMAIPKIGVLGQIMVAVTPEPRESPSESGGKHHLTPTSDTSSVGGKWQRLDVDHPLPMVVVPTSGPVVSANPPVMQNDPPPPGKHGYGSRTGGGRGRLPRLGCMV